MIPFPWVLCVVDENIIRQELRYYSAFSLRKQIFIETDIVEFLIPSRFFTENPFQLRFFSPISPQKKGSGLIILVSEHT